MGKSKQDYIGCFAGEWFSKRRTKQHLLDEIRMQLILLIDLPSLSSKENEENIQLLARIMQRARKIKKRKLPMVFDKINQHYFETVELYNKYRESENKEDRVKSSVYRTIGTDNPTSQLFLSSAKGAKLGIIAKYWQLFAEKTTFTEKERRIITPYNKEYWRAILNVYLFARYDGDRKNLTAEEIINKSAQQCVDEDIKLFQEAYGKQESTTQKEVTNDI